MWSSQPPPPGPPPPPPDSTGGGGPPGGPPPPAFHYSQQGQRAPPVSHSHDEQEEDNYYDDHDESGALSSTINLVTSAASALFTRASSTGTSTIASSGVQQQQPPPPTTTFAAAPAPLVPETTMLGAAPVGRVPSTNTAPPVGPPPTLLQQPQQQFMHTNAATANPSSGIPFASTSNATIATTAGPPPVAVPPSNVAPPPTTSHPPAYSRVMASPQGPPSVVRQRTSATMTATFAPPASPRVVGTTSGSRPLSLPRTTLHHSPRVQLKLPSPKASPTVKSATRRAFGGFKMPPPLNSATSKPPPVQTRSSAPTESVSTAMSTTATASGAPSIPTLPEPDVVPPHPPTSGLLPPLSQPPAVARILPTPEMEVPQQRSQDSVNEAEILRKGETVVEQAKIELESSSVNEGIEIESNTGGGEDEKQNDNLSTVAPLLANGWAEHVDPTSNRSYYVHVDGTTTWERPTEIEEQVDDAALGEDPVIDVKEEVNEPLPVEEEPEEAPPVDLAIEEERRVIDEDAIVEDAAETPIESSGLPAGWQELIDEGSGMPYYYQASENVTTWERPEPAVAEEAKCEIQPESTGEPDMIGRSEQTGSEVEEPVPESTAPSQETPEPPVEADSVEDTGSPETGQEEEALPEGWVEEVDGSSGMPFFYHIGDRLGTSTWERPPKFDVAPEADEQKQAESEVTDEVVPMIFESSAEEIGVEKAQDSVGSHEISALPDGWAEYVDPSSGRSYYVNALNGQTSWDRPSIPTEVAEDVLSSEAIAGVTDAPSVDTDAVEATPGTNGSPESLIVEAMRTDLGQDISPENQVDEQASPEAEVTEGSSGVVQDEPRPTESVHSSEAHLPEGWQELIDESSGSAYFFHAAENVTSWERPVQSQVEMSVEAVDLDTCDQFVTGAQPEDTGRPVAEDDTENEPTPEQTSASAEERDGEWNIVSPEIVDGKIPSTYREDTTMNPEDQVESSSGAAYKSEASPVETEVPPDRNGELPPDWTEVFDPSGTPYYVNEVTGVATWERPFVPPDEITEPRMEHNLSEASDAADGTTPAPVGEVEEPKIELVETTRPATHESMHEDVNATHEHTVEEKVEIQPSALPPGWIELVDPASGNTYYLNEGDNTTTWERPTNEKTKSEESNASGVVDDGEKEQESVAGAPVESIIEDSSAATPSEAPEDDAIESIDEVAEASEGEDALPQGWVKLIDQTSGHPYYLNESEGTTTWERPVIAPTADKTTEIAPNEQLEPRDERTDAAPPKATDTPMPDSREPGKATNVDVPSCDKEGEALPEGWVEYADPASGQPYYLHEADNVTTWERPREPEPGVKKAPERESAPESQGGSSLGFGEYTMIDHADAESKNHPDQPSQRDSITEWRSEGSAVPSGWTEHVDPSSGKTYYFNAERNSTSWDIPIEASSTLPSVKGSMSPDKSQKPHAIAVFGFGGRLCVWRPALSSAVAVHSAGELLPSEPISMAENAKSDDGVVGPLNACRNEVVLKHVEGRTVPDASEEVSKSLLWNLVWIASNSRGRLRSEEGMRDPESPEAAVTKLLLDASGNESIQAAEDAEALEGIVGNSSPSSLGAVEDLLLLGKREQAVDEALSSKNFAMALLVASMCDRNTFQRATRSYAEEILASGSPLHTLAMLFSGQLQPPKDSSLDRAGSRPSMWAGSLGENSSTWKRHLAAIVSNRTLGWDRIVLSLGDSLLELGNVHAAHFCYMVCGCPVTSIHHPSTRIAIVGCDHLVPMDTALWTTEGVLSYARTEAYEWAKRRGNPNAAIQSLQPFKLMYAMLLADMGFTETARLYVTSIRECTGLAAGSPSGRSPASTTIWALTERETFALALTEFETRLSGRSTPCASSDPGHRIASPNRMSGVDKVPREVSANYDYKQMSVAETPHRGGAATNVPSMSDPSPSKPLAQFVPAKIAPEDDPNASFLSAQSNLLDVTASSAVERSGTSLNRRKQPTTMTGVNRPSGSMAVAPARPSIASAGPPTAMSMRPVPDTKTSADADSKRIEAERKGEIENHPHAPTSAPAQMISGRETPNNSPQKKAPSSEKKLEPAPWSLGLKDKMAKWLNPEATTADLGEQMQAYYDKDLGCWVFPGEDPVEKAKPIGPPPTAPGPRKEAEPEKKDPLKNDDPLAAMMAPPNALRRPGIPPGRANIRAQSYPGMPQLGATAAGPPKFAVFTPPVVPESSKADEKNSRDE